MSLIVAFDGGTTQTRAGLYTADRELLAEATGPAANPVEYGVGHCVGTLVSLARNVGWGPPGVVVGGISGVSRARLRDQVAVGLARALGAGRVLIADDLHPVLAANAGDEAAVLAIAGTGSSVVAQAEGGAWALVGGRGRLFGDEGSAYQVAATALRAAARAVDGLGPDTELVKELPKAAGVEDFSRLVAWGASAKKQDVAGLAETVDAAAAAGDGVAKGCIEEQAVCLAAQTVAAARRLGLPETAAVFMQGGLAEGSELFRAAYESALAREGFRAKPRVPPLRGYRAVLELAFTEGAAPDWLSVCAGEAAGDDLAMTEEAVRDGPPLDRLPALEIVKRMSTEDARVAGIVAGQLEPIAAAIEAVAQALDMGGRLIYVGAGTSGRLGVLDAAECPPTFGVSSDTVLALIAGGERALSASVEGAEDDVGAAVGDLGGVRPAVGSRDVVVGISASGRTPYVLAALEAAKAAGAKTVLVCCNPVAAPVADIVIAAVTGAEVVAGSTRLKAGTATKLVLNMISTGAMALAGRVYEGYMVGMAPVNEKLRRRAARVVAALTELPLQEAAGTLDKAGGRIPVAVLMGREGIEADVAAQRLARARGRLRQALESK